MFCWSFFKSVNNILRGVSLNPTQQQKTKKTSKNAQINGEKLNYAKMYNFVVETSLSIFERNKKF